VFEQFENSDMLKQEQILLEQLQLKLDNAGLGSSKVMDRRNGGTADPRLLKVRKASVFTIPEHVDSPTDFEYETLERQPVNVNKVTPVFLGFPELGVGTVVWNSKDEKAVMQMAVEKKGPALPPTDQQEFSRLQGYFYNENPEAEALRKIRRMPKINYDISTTQNSSFNFIVPDKGQSPDRYIAKFSQMGITLASKWSDYKSSDKETSKLIMSRTGNSRKPR
jgi:hypothetical protein